MAKSCPILKKINTFKEDKSRHPSRMRKNKVVDISKRKKSLNEIINKKKTHFSRTGTKAERSKNKTEGLNIMFSNIDLKNKLEENPYCYWSGKPIDFNDSSSWSLDHKLPRSRGGDNSLDNCVPTTQIANQMKHNQTESEFKENIAEIAIHMSKTDESLKKRLLEGLQNINGEYNYG